jgi:hypothetical protein
VSAAELVRRLRGEMLGSVAAFEHAEADFAAVTAQYLVGANDARGRVDALVRASADPDRRQAQADAAYHRDRALMYAAAIQALHVPLLGLLRRLPRESTDEDLRDAHAPTRAAGDGYALGAGPGRRVT